MMTSDSTPELRTCWEMSRGLASAAGPRVASPPPNGLASLPVSGLASLSVGRGLRFNNPYRLARPLGDSAESVSLAATYLDLGLGLLFGGRDFRHGVALGGAHGNAPASGLAAPHTAKHLAGWQGGVHRIPGFAQGVALHQPVWTGVVCGW